LLAADHPAQVGVDEVQRPQRGAHPGGLALPVLAAVDTVPDGPVVADRPALPGVDELDGAEAGVVEVARVGPARGRQGSEQPAGGGQPGGGSDAGAAWGSGEDGEERGAGCEGGGKGLAGADGRVKPSLDAGCVNGTRRQAAMK